MNSNIKRLILSLISLTASISLTGCSSFVSTRMPSGGESMAQVYTQAINGSHQGSIDQLRSTLEPLSTNRLNQDVNYTKYSLDQKNAIQDLFPRLPNPNVVMYVYPHLAGTSMTKSPIPGYSTVFPLYTRTHYALPGEVSN